jgi:hypothetical protein
VSYGKAGVMAFRVGCRDSANLLSARFGVVLDRWASRTDYLRGGLRVARVDWQGRVSLGKVF